MVSGPSLAGRAVLALALMIGFYVLALAIVAVLIAIPFVEVVYLHHMYVKLTIICLICAALILWSLVPRPDRFNPPWPRLTAEEHPRLFAEIYEVAKLTGQEMPAEVYLDPDVNAWVAQRGGIMAIGSRRVMGIGLPLMAVLSVAELRAVMAHEFGHYHGGDTRLGPWVYKTRIAIIRTVQNLARGGSALLQKPFVWYGNMFLRITHAISRRQELAADALAAQVAGAGAQSSALRTIHRAALGFQPFIQSELEPVLGAGYRPPIASGFTRFLGATPIVRAVDEMMQKELQSTEKNPYDTHPPIRERLAAMEVLPQDGMMRGGEDPALSLLDRVAEMEARLLKAMVTKQLSPVDWDAVGQKVYIPMWEEHLKKHGAALKGMTPLDLPALAADPASSSSGLAAAVADLEEKKRLVFVTVGAALATALQKRGWALAAEPGAEVALRLGDKVVHPFGVIGQLADGKLSADAWRKTCEEAGIADLALVQ